METYLLQITAIIPQPGENITLELKAIGKPFPPYQTGQFLALVFKSGQREIRRSYSFNSCPDLDEPLSITIKRVENGEISRLLHHKTEVGDLLTALPPQGRFVYEPAPALQRTLFLFAAGVGITPLFSILKTALTTENLSRVVLVYSNRSPEDALFREALQQWENRFPGRLQIIWVFSNSKNLLKARLNQFYLEEIIGKHLQFRREDALFYTCGPVIYMDLCQITLLGLGFDPGQLKRETFVLPEDEEDEDDDTVKVVDTRAYQVTIHFQEQVYPLLIPYDKSILDVALEAQIPLPYSCRSGMCSTCITTCTEGNVRMDYNEILTDKELAEGKVLICTGHPATEGTVIRYS